MNLEERKAAFVKRFIAINDEALIASLESMVSSENLPKGVVAYNVHSGRAVTEKDFELRLNQAKIDFEAGQYTTLEEFKEKMKNWA